MRCMVIMKASPESEEGVMPSQAALAEMGRFNEALDKAGILITGEGLQPSRKGHRVHFSGTQTPTVSDGPFAETKELVAGFWLWEVPDMATALSWAKRIPNTEGGECEVEVRPVMEAEDFGDSFTPELREQEELLRQRLVDRQ